MCEQCLAEMTPVVIDILPNFALYRATKDGGRLKANDYGLVECNDPSFVFSVTPSVEPDETSDSWVPWASAATLFGEQLFEQADSMKSIYKLVDGCYKSGYKDEDGFIGMWLFNYLAKEMLKFKI